MIERVKKITQRISMSCLGVSVKIAVKMDKIYTVSNNGRIYLQAHYEAPDTHTGVLQEWSGRKWYLSEFMTDDEIVKTAYVAFESCVKHEIMEGFKVDGVILFNPHVAYDALLEVSHKEVKRN
jgi:hypothetical protein